MDAVMCFLWAVLGILAFIACLRNQGALYIYLASGFLAAAFMAFFGGSFLFQIVLGILVIITAMIFGEAGVHAYFFVFLAIDILFILVYFLFFRV
ncbi:MAG: hypothetical protein DRN71_04920 [Candidatus Nanohalarchaeota archaeon]|nr:MAG: hypothetical protein DRN71_04920 [Candidatus Nanohaloarchaeota archaeon]